MSDQELDEMRDWSFLLLPKGGSREDKESLGQTDYNENTQNLK